MLTQPLLAEETDFGSEGGIYSSPFGQWDLDESGRELTLKLDPPTASNAVSRPTSDAIARFLLELATPGSPNFRADVASLIESISISADNAVVLHLKRVHVRPESIFQIPLPTPAVASSARSATSAAPYAIADYSPNQVAFTAAKNAAGPPAGPQAIVEQTMPSDEAAVAALIAGEVDVLDRVPPWHVERLAQ